MILVRKSAARRGTPLVLTSVAALATAFMAPSALAQTTSFNAGNPIVRSGTVTFDRGVTTPGTEVYTINTRTAVLDFTPTDTAIAGGSWINFQNAGTTVRYTNGANTPTFTVLNRIVPADQSRPIQFNGRVISEIRSGQTVSPGGDVWFYSPGGIVLGATAAFDIGSLLLTTRDPTNGTGVISSTAQFRGGGAAGSFIDIQQGATINASSEGSYVALMSPLVRQFGSVRVNGSAAYVAAEDATVTINSGLFDISVTTGTDTGQGFPLLHYGTTSGPASSGGADPHRIYMVAVPKNTAITLLVGETSRLGYDAATVAGVENGRVILSAGYGVSGGALSTLSLTTDPQGIVIQPGTANVNVSGGTVTSNFFARASTNAFIASTTGTATFTGDVFLQGGARADIGARRAGETLSIGGNLTLSTDNGINTNRTSGAQTVVDSSGGRTFVYAENGGTLTIGGSLTATANAFYSTFGNQTAGPLSPIYSGGEASMFASNGTIRIAGSTIFSAQSTGGANSALSRDLRGGRAGISTSQGGTIQLNGASNSINAGAVSLASAGVANLTGGSTYFNINTGGGNISATGNVSLFSQASGFSNTNTGGGNATAGSASLFLGGGVMTIGGNLVVSSDAYAAGSNIGTPGNALGGNSSINAAAGSSLTVGGTTTVSSYAGGGALLGGPGTAGGAAQGGVANILADGGLTFTGGVLMQVGAAGGSNSRTGGTGAGGAAIGGRAFLRANTGTITTGSFLNLSASAFGGAVGSSSAGDGGAANGGFAGVNISNAAGRVTIADTLSVTADASGGVASGASGRNGVGAGGVGQNGAYVSADGGLITVGGNLSVSTFAVGSSSTGGNSTVATSNGGSILLNGANNNVYSLSNLSGLASGGTTTGGLATVTTAAGSGGIQTTGNLDIVAQAFGRSVAAGANATGGRAVLFSNGAPILVGGALRVDAAGFAQDNPNGTGGIGRGGTAEITSGTGGSITVRGTTYLTAYAAGGAATGTTIANGGAAIGGNATINALTGGTITLEGATTVTTGAAGGALQRTAGPAGGTGGAGSGGAAAVIANGSLAFGSSLSVESLAFGGNSSANSGGDGGTGTSGFARVLTNLPTSRLTVAGSTNVSASAFGGSASGTTGRGGDGLAGNGTNTLSAALIHATGGVLTLSGPVGLSANGTGGAGITGGIGRGGALSFNAYDGTLTATGPLTASANGVGGLANTGVSGQTGGAGGDAFGGTLLLLSNNMNDRTTGAVRVGAVNATATATGGQGALGLASVGGRGGNAQGGVMTAYASGSTLGITAGAVNFNASAIGGAGGAGGAGGFAGGTGGNAVAGAGQVGTQSGVNLMPNTGFATFGDVFLIGNGTGGAGGVGGAAGAGGVEGVGGAGGTGQGGRHVLLSRGTPVTTGALTMIARGQGGAGGRGSVVGAGGAALGGATDIVTSTRFERTERGRVTTGNVVMDASAVGGAGAITGSATTGRGSISVSGADVTLANLIYTGSGTAAPAVPGFLVDAASGSVTVTNSMRIQTPGNIAATLSANGVLRAATLNVDATGSLMLTTSGGPGATVGDLDFDNFTGVFGGDFVFNAPIEMPGTFDVTAARVTLGNVTAGGIRIATPGLADLSGALIAPTISIRSGDINLGAQARIGNGSTQRITLSNFNPSTTMTVGGDATESQTGYLLSNAEIGRLTANQIELTAASAANTPGNLLVRNLTLTGTAGSGGNLVGQNAEFRITGDVVRVEGGLSLQNAATTDTLSLIGARRVEVVTDQGGSVSVTGVASGDVRPLAGVLALSAPVIGVGTNALLTQLAADPRFSGRNALLAAPPATPVPAGYVQANQLILTTTNVAAIQNSGTAATFGGFTAGLGGLLVRAPDGAQAGSTPAQVVVYGRVQRPNGGFYDTTDVGGGAAFATGQQALFDRNSTVNGCAVGATCGSEPAVIVATVNAIEEVLAASTSAAIEVPAIRVVQIVNQADLAVEQVITEPVSGAGNASLWDTGDDEEEDEDDPAVAPAAAGGGQTR